MPFDCFYIISDFITRKRIPEFKIIYVIKSTDIRLETTNQVIQNLTIFLNKWCFKDNRDLDPTIKIEFNFKDYNGIKI